MEVMLLDKSPEQILEYLADPYWFQSLGCVLGFDWHSSGLTTTTMGALKESISEIDPGIYICGGKGKTSLKTPDEIKEIGVKTGINADPLIYTSRITAKVDNTAIQDGYSLYHHNIIFTDSGNWAIIQQGMNKKNRMARRYHWLSESTSDYVREPHSGIITEGFTQPLNMIDGESEESRKITVDISREYPEKNEDELKKIKELILPERHQIKPSDININRLKKPLRLAFERKPETFENLLGIKGVGPATIRALALIGELLYGRKPSYRDPARYSFAHGGKDGIPYPVNENNYEKSINFLKNALNHARIGKREKLRALKRLGTMN